MPISKQQFSDNAAELLENVNRYQRENLIDRHAKPGRATRCQDTANAKVNYQGAQ